MSLTYVERVLSPMNEGMLEWLWADAGGRKRLVVEARAAQAEFRGRSGYKPAPARLTTPPENQVKLHKSERPTFGLSLVPADGLGLVEGRPVNMCPMSTAACRADCLGLTSGHQVFQSVRRAQEVRSRWLMYQPFFGGALYMAELGGAASQLGSIATRPNVISDIRWELVIGSAMRASKALFDIQYYDYTKYLPKQRRGAAGLGYDLTYSFHDKMSRATARWLLGHGYRVAVVFKSPVTTSPKELKALVRDAVERGGRWEGFPLVDGVSTDDRSLDPGGVVVALAGLGAAARWGSKLSVPLSEIKF